jgi:hypothetical protein
MLRGTVFGHDLGVAAGGGGQRFIPSQGRQTLCPPRLVHGREEFSFYSNALVLGMCRPAKHDSHQRGQPDPDLYCHRFTCESSVGIDQ